MTPFTRRVDGRVLRAVRSQRIVREGEPALLAVSGGPDSTALLLILARLHERLGIAVATAAHFDHRLRSREEAEGDREFVRELAGVLGVPFVAGRGDVRARVRKTGESGEGAARRPRH